ncbi:hypothetical protein ACIRYZ_44900 [Kitasatospora sp. NPDC101155]|uniref:hypothetical protein n=1 Tax=Kitasatospora sp. NPDC101155 TaxID=3364097 RepID=UPI00382AF0B7
MKQLLQDSKECGWISDLHPVPVQTVGDVALGLAAPKRGELVVVDLHGAANEDGVWLGPLDREPFFNLREIPSDSWSVSAIVLTGCEGSQQEAWQELQRINTGRLAAIGHFAIAPWHDRVPVEVVRTILASASGGDEWAACSAALEVISAADRWSPDEPWAAELLPRYERMPAGGS